MTDPGTTSLLQRWVIDGGFMMVGLVPAAILTVAYSIQGFLNLRRSRVAPPGFIARLGEIKRISGAETARQSLTNSRHSIAVVLLNVLAHLRIKGDADAAEVLREEIENECDLLAQQNSQLSIIYTVAPLMGLLGTVFGMLGTFNEFTSAANPRIQELAGGINIALITTAWGLGIAIPAFLILSLIRAKISTYETQILPTEGAEALRILIGEDAALSDDLDT